VIDLYLATAIRTLCRTIDSIRLPTSKRAFSPSPESKQKQHTTYWQPHIRHATISSLPAPRMTLDQSKIADNDHVHVHTRTSLLCSDCFFYRDARCMMHGNATRTWRVWMETLGTWTVRRCERRHRHPLKIMVADDRADTAGAKAQDNTSTYSKATPG